MKINQIEIIEQGNDVQIRSLVEYIGRTEYLWYAVDKRYEQYVTTEKMDGFLVGLLLLAMKHKEDMEIDGAISEKLYYNINNYYMSILRLVIPSLHPINIIPKRLDEGKSYHCEKGVVTGFSGGIDSFCTVFDHLGHSKPLNYRITHFLFNNVGSHGEWDPPTARNLFNQRYDRLKLFGDEMGLEFMKVDSNLSEFLKFNYEISHFPRNLSPVLLFQKLFSKYYYSGSFRYKDCFVGPTYDIAYSDPAAVHLLSTETLECVSTGCQYSRVEKTRKVSEIEPTYRYLNVCIRTDGNWANCSVCSKCCRTLLTLEMLGKLEKYGKVFNLEKYRKVKNGYVRHIFRNKKDPLYKEILELAKKTAFRFPVVHVILAYVSSILLPLPLEKRMKRTLPNSLKRRIRYQSAKAGFF